MNSVFFLFLQNTSVRSILFAQLINNGLIKLREFKPRTLSLKQARLLVVKNYLKLRQKPESLAKELLKACDEMQRTGLITNLRHFLLDGREIVKTYKASYINSQMLSLILGNLEDVVKTRQITKSDCVFRVNKKDWEEILVDYRINLCEP